MQILTVLAREEALWGVRLYDIQKILAADLLVSDEKPQDSVIGWIEEGGQKIAVLDLRIGLDTDRSEAPTKILLIGSPSGKRFALAIENMGRVLRVPDNGLRPEPCHLGGFGCLKGPKVKGSDLYVVDPDGSAFADMPEPAEKPETSEESASTPAENLPDDFLTQIGKTAREIQKILSMSDSMLDTMKLVENRLPSTSGGLETVSRMTEEAAHTLLAVLESSLETNQEIRTSLRKHASDPASLQKEIPAIETLLANQETRILEGFEAMVFQDLVGQNLRKITQTLNDLEKRLLEILVEFSPERDNQNRPEPSSDRTSSGADALELKGVSSESTFSQDSVDKLLSEFGF
ncbi:MAG: protein phosphatase CheZ [Nitrospirae bacterium]|nr:protein phosphatase CheZ [Nitrospirota bacterium]